MPPPTSAAWWITSTPRRMAARVCSTAAASSASAAPGLDPLHRATLRLEALEDRLLVLLAVAHQDLGVGAVRGPGAGSPSNAASFSAIRWRHSSRSFRSEGESSRWSSKRRIGELSATCQAILHRAVTDFGVR